MFVFQFRVAVFHVAKMVIYVCAKILVFPFKNIFVIDSQVGALSRDVLDAIVYKRFLCILE